MVLPIKDIIKFMNILICGCMLILLGPIQVLTPSQVNDCGILLCRKSVVMVLIVTKQHQMVAAN